MAECDRGKKQRIESPSLLGRGRGGVEGNSLISHLLPLTTSIHENLQVSLLFFYPLNVHINEYVLFIDVFEFGNIKPEK